ncbi:spermidine synthase [Marinibaculum pumilum]|uniref:Spermidine synthase n=1 Tax=Marinibaculum pumilum TaxID=1766165 RepID=A0ABV7KWQ0_9PROT
MPLFEELDYRPTAMGTLSLRRRREPRFDVDVLEIKLDDEFLMSSLFTDGEVALADLALNAHGAGDPADSDLAVAVGGLGLGYTARAALDHPAVSGLLVVEAAPEVVDWHRQGLLPLGARLVADRRCRIVTGDFFALAASADGFDPQQPGRRFDAILLDIDHSPSAVLQDAHGRFYSVHGLAGLGRHLRPGGIFGLWSNERPDPDFLERLAQTFDWSEAHEVPVHDPHGGLAGRNTIYLARDPR